jgi:hypothetical protein
VRLEAFIDQELRIKLSSVHFEEWIPSPSHKLTNWDIEKDSFNPQLDERNNWNRAQAVFNYQPHQNENAETTSFYRNNASIAQAGKELSKQVVFPNLYIKSDVIYQLKEMIKLASSYAETATLNITWRSILLDLGDFVKLDIGIGSNKYEAVPAMIREIGYDPSGMKMAMKLWIFQMTPFGSWNPGYSGIVGGQYATIVEE